MSSVLQSLEAQLATVTTAAETLSLSKFGELTASVAAGRDVAAGLRSALESAHQATGRAASVADADSKVAADLADAFARLAQLSDGASSAPSARMNVIPTLQAAVASACAGTDGACEDAVDLVTAAHRQYSPAVQSAHLQALLHGADAPAIPPELSATLQLLEEVREQWQELQRGTEALLSARAPLPVMLRATVNLRRLSQSLASMRRQHVVAAQSGRSANELRPDAAGHIRCAEAACATALASAGSRRGASATGNDLPSALRELDAQRSMWLEFVTHTTASIAAVAPSAAAPADGAEAAARAAAAAAYSASLRSFLRERRAQLLRYVAQCVALRGDPSELAGLAQAVTFASRRVSRVGASMDGDLFNLLDQRARSVAAAATDS